MSKFFSQSEEGKGKKKNKKKRKDREVFRKKDKNKEEKSKENAGEKPLTPYDDVLDKNDSEFRNKTQSEPVDQQMGIHEKGIEITSSQDKKEDHNNKFEESTLKILYDSRKSLYDLSIKQSSYQYKNIRKIKNHIKRIPEVKFRVRKKLIPINLMTYKLRRIQPNRKMDKVIQPNVINALIKKELEKKEQEILEKELGEISSQGDNGDLSRDHLWDLIEWDRDEQKVFSQILDSKESLYILLIGEKKKFPLKKLFIRLLSTEFKRKYSSIESSFEIEDFSDKNIIVQLIHSDDLRKIVSKDNDKEDFIKELENLMTSQDMTSPEGKLILFDCTNLEEKDTEFIYQAVSDKFPHNTFILKSKYQEIPADIKNGIIKNIKWMLSILSYNPPFEYKDIDKEFNELLKFSNIRKKDLKYDVDLGYITGTEAGQETDEHLILKLLAFKKLKEKFEETQIKVEVKAEGEKIPDLKVDNEIWVEIETLLGLESPNFLIPNKISRKKENIKSYNEFWLVIPNFEMFIHDRAIKALSNQLRKTLGEQIKIKIFGADYLKKTLIKKFEAKK